MGRPLLIIIAGLFVAFSYIFLGMNSRKLSMNKQNVKTHDAIKAKNSAHTGIQIAIQKFNESNNTWEGPETVNYEDSELTISLDEVKPDTIRVTSKSNYHEAEHTVISTFYIGQKQPLVPEFLSALSIATENFTFDINGNAAQINGNDTSEDARCSDKPGVAVTSDDGKSTVGQYSAITGTSDNEAAVDGNLESEFDKAEELITMLEDQPGVQYLTGDQRISEMGTAQDPGIFFIEENIKLAGGIEEGFGIMVVRSNADFDYEGGLEVNGNFTFNGLVIFQNASEFDAAGTPNINGSVLIGNSEGEGFYPTSILIKGDVTVQSDCSAKDYADDAVNNLLNTTLYQQLSIYE